MLVAIEEFTAQTFEFRCVAVEKVVLNEHKGSALRGALFHSLRRAGCSHQELKSCHPCPLVSECPVSFLLATVDESSNRGRDVPRPFVINAPLQHRNIFEPGDEITFSLTLFASTVNFLPYLLIAVQNMEREGLGIQYEVGNGRWRRGSVRVRQILARNPLTGQSRSIFHVGKRYFDQPTNPVTHSQILSAAALQPDTLYKLHFTFHTPTVLVREGKPLPHPDLPTLIHRLCERFTSLSAHYGNGGPAFDLATMLDEARQMLLVEDRTHWEDLRSYSNRQHQDVSISGFVGDAIYAGCVDNILPLLLWGQITHVGKDATKGNGWYSLEYEPLSTPE